MMRRALTIAAHGELNHFAAMSQVGSLTVQAFGVIAPVLAVIWTAATLVGVLQAGGVFTAEQLRPDFNRVNPATGLKRMFSVRSLHELARCSIKVAVFGTAMTIWGKSHIGELLNLSARSPRSMEQEGIALLGSALTLLTGLMLLFAMLDWSFNRWEFLRQMRMSKREMKDEHKEREGDPRIKSRLRELRLSWLKRARQLANVRNADVLLTNPTHYAVALEYRRGEMYAPMITARGAGEMAHLMRKEARRRGVAVVENAPLARALFALNESATFVPAEHFEQVARVLRWVYSTRGQRRDAGVRA
jgi:flagellar biosynthetic protein FlhB